jgi:hypothetical protein
MNFLDSDRSTANFHRSSSIKKVYLAATIGSRVSREMRSNCWRKYLDLRTQSTIDKKIVFGRVKVLKVEIIM